MGKKLMKVDLWDYQFLLFSVFYNYCKTVNLGSILLSCR